MHSEITKLRELPIKECSELMRQLATGNCFNGGTRIECENTFKFAVKEIVPRF